MRLLYKKGEILSLIPKVYLPNYGEFYEQRWFHPGSGGVDHDAELCGQDVSLNCNQVFTPVRTCRSWSSALEICEDLWAPAPPSVGPGRKGATVIPEPLRIQ